ncbi:MAG: hypothetical protein RJB66_797 [Pseudomonadota bacterium]|jgi:hypothetical protein
MNRKTRSFATTKSFSRKTIFGLSQLTVVLSLTACGSQGFLMFESTVGEDPSSLLSELKADSKTLTRAVESSDQNACQKKLRSVIGHALGEFDEIKVEGSGVIGCAEFFLHHDPLTAPKELSCEDSAVYKQELSAALASDECLGMDPKPFNEMYSNLQRISSSFMQCYGNAANCFKPSFAEKKSAEILREYIYIALETTKRDIEEGIFLVSQGQSYNSKRLLSRFNKLRIAISISSAVVPQTQSIVKTMGAVIKNAGPVAPPTKADLVITKIGGAGNLKANDMATLSLTIKNQGQTDIPADTWLGAGIQIIDDKTTFTWAGLTLTAPLRAGEEVVIETPEAQRWVATAGKKRVRVFIDDQRKVDEHDEFNNSFMTNITVEGSNATAPFAIVSDLSGPIENRSFGYKVTVPQDLQGKSGAIYVAAIVRGSPENIRYYLNDNGEWIKHDGVTPPPAYEQTGYLQSSYRSMIEIDADLTNLVGTDVYVGIGLGPNSHEEMMSGNRFNFIYSVSK